MKRTIVVLIVDDNPVNRIAVRNMLSELNVEIIEADSGEEAIRLCGQLRIDMILMDIMMPGMDGITATRRIRAMLGSTSDIRIVANSGAQVVDVEDFLIENQFDDLILKPVQMDRLQECMAQWFSITMKQDENSKEELSSQWKTIQYFYGNIRGLSLEDGMHYVRGNAQYYLKVMKASIKQLKLTIIQINEAMEYFDLGRIYQQLHSIKSVFSYLRAEELEKESAYYESIFYKEKQRKLCGGKECGILKDFLTYIDHISVFYSALEQAEKAYNNSITTDEKDLEKEMYSLFDINRQIDVVLHHISRYEYLEIVSGMEQLIKMVSENKAKLIIEAMTYIEEFDYENVKNLMIEFQKQINE